MFDTIRHVTPRRDLSFYCLAQHSYGHQQFYNSSADIVQKKKTLIFYLEVPVLSTNIPDVVTTEITRITTRDVGAQRPQ